MPQMHPAFRRMSRSPSVSQDGPSWCGRKHPALEVPVYSEVEVPPALKISLGVLSSVA